MQSKLVIVDKIKLQHKLNCNFACSYSEDQRLSLISENGVYVFELGCDSENRTSAFSFIKSFFGTPQYRVNTENVGAFAVTDNVGININNFIDSLSQYDIYECIMDVNISQNLKGATSVQVVPIATQWSPKGLDKGQFCLLAVLSNTGVLEILARKLSVSDINEYYSACNITEYCVNTFRRDFKDVSKLPADEQLVELKNRVKKVRVTAFAWGDVYKSNDSNCCFLFCGHEDGGVSVWNIFSNRNCDLYTVQNSYFKSSLSHITAMSWLKGENASLLIMGDFYGRISAVIVTNINDSMQFDETLLYSTCDDVKIECIKHICYDELMYIVITKGIVVVTFVFNANCEFLDQKLFYCGNLAITGVEHYEKNTILILTYTGVLKELQLLYANNALHIESRDLCTDINWQKYRAHGIFLSHNRVYIGLVIHPCRMKDFAKVNHYMNVVIIKNQAKNPMKILLNNKSGSLQNYWDCLEIVRIYGLRHKKYPCEKYPFILKLDYDSLTLLELKTLLHISKITRVIYSRKVQDVNRNIESVTTLAVIVQIKLAIKRMKDLVQQHATGKQLTQFQMNSLELADAYLREIILGGILKKFGLTKNTADEMYDLMARVHNMEFPPMPSCFSCKNTISGFTCFPPHTDTRCAISFMQIDGPVCYKCAFCKCTVHKFVIEEENYVDCPFCDLPLQQTFFKDKLQDTTRSSCNENVDLCDNDCVTEELDINDVEEEAFVEIDNFGYIPTAAPNWDQISISDASTADDSDVDYIYGKEVAGKSSNKAGILQQMDAD